MNSNSDNIKKAILLESQGHYNQAKTILEDYLSIYPSNYEAIILLGTVFKNSNNSKKAMEYFSEAYSINPERPDAYNNIGTLHFNKKNIDLALKFFKKAFFLMPDEENIRDNYASALYLKGDFDQALNVLKDSPTNINYEKFLKCLLAKEEYDEFWNTLERLKSKPTDIGVAAISAYASEKLEKKDPYEFCRNPLDHIYFSKINLLDQTVFDLIKKVKISIDKQKHQFVTQNLIFNGNQSSGNFFNNSELGYLFGSYITELVSDYKKSFIQKESLIYSDWPKKK